MKSASRNGALRLEQHINVASNFWALWPKKQGKSTAPKIRLCQPLSPPHPPPLQIQPQCQQQCRRLRLPILPIPPPTIEDQSRVVGFSNHPWVLKLLNHLLLLLLLLLLRLLQLLPTAESETNGWSWKSASTPTGYVALCPRDRPRPREPPTSLISDDERVAGVLLLGVLRECIEYVLRAYTKWWFEDIYAGPTQPLPDLWTLHILEFSGQKSATDS